MDKIILLCTEIAICAQMTSEGCSIQLLLSAMISMNSTYMDMQGIPCLESARTAQVCTWKMLAPPIIYMLQSKMLQELMPTTQLATNVNRRLFLVECWS